MAVSGGPDSVALLHILWRLRRQKRWKILAAHVQHRLRGEESLRDQKFVQTLCKTLGLPCVVRLAPVLQFRQAARQSKSKLRLGIEETARLLRYKALAKIVREYGASALLTAHTSNDQSETFFLHLIRGSGLQGLCGIYPIRSLNEITREKKDTALLIRPALAFERQEIVRYLQSQDLQFCEDRTNQDTRFLRNWVRLRLIPLLKEVQPRVVSRIGSLTSILQRDTEFWPTQLEAMKKKILIPPRCSRLDLEAFFGYDMPLRYRFLHELFPRKSHRFIEDFHARLEQKKIKLRKRFLSHERSHG
ncbi:MAG: tRNA lysidine(34) synthetase TilS [Elusimicrobia bacterium]|nr:tRNA lysidine(34) synthetase TilS [Elusimicrobiota bacterium]